MTEPSRAEIKQSAASRKARVHLMRRIGLAVLLSALASASITACAGSDDSNAGKSNSSEPALPVVDTAPGGDAPLDNITWGIPTTPPTLDPALGGDYADEVRTNLCESIVRFKPDGTTSMSLAESVDNPDPKTFIYNVRPGVEFWDGQELTAEDVAYSLNRNLDPKLASHFGTYYGDVASIKASGPRQVTIKMKRPSYLFQSFLGTFAGAIVQKKYAEKAGKEFGTAKGGLMCTGPYQVKSYTSDSVVLSANPSYWDKDLQPKTSTLTFRSLPDEDTIVSALVAGQLDGAALFSATAPARLQNSGPGKLYFGSGTYDLQVIVTKREGPLQDPRAREALSLAIPRDGIAKTVYSGAASPAKSIISAIQPWSYAPSQFERYFQDRKPLSTNGDADKARAMVKAAGLDGKKVNIAVSSTYKDVTAVIVETANKIGLDAKTTTLTTDQSLSLYYDEKLRDRFDAFVMPWNTNTPDPLENLVYFQPGNVYNYAGYDNPKFTKLVDQALGTADPDERARLVLQAITILDQDRPWIAVVDTPGLIYLNKRIGGAPVSLTGHVWGQWGAYVGGN
jgi:peptide/nickel transport system substrate-binding protein